VQRHHYSFAMPRFQYGTHQIYCLPDFAAGAIAAVTEEDATPTPTVYDFSKLTAKGITGLMDVLMRKT
jgi:hypothetical protein